MSIFNQTLNQMLVLFLFILIGYIIQKIKIVPDNSATILSKLETYLFVPAVVLGTFISNCTLDLIINSWKLVVFGGIIAFLTLFLGLFLAKIITKDDFIRKTYAYGLCFANFSFMGIPIVKALYANFLTEYLLFTLPAQVIVYSFAMSNLLIPKDCAVTISKDEKVLKKFYYKIKPLINPMFIAVVLGIVIGISGLKLPQFLTNTINTAGNCMSCLAMLLTGMVVAKYNLVPVLKTKSLYVVTFLRLFIIPAVFCGILLIFTNILDFSSLTFLKKDNLCMICLLCYTAMPLGLNTVVIPTAYGKDTSLAAGMALLSHVLAVLTIPLTFAIFM